MDGECACELCDRVLSRTNLFEYFDLVLPDVDGTLNAHHPEQNGHATGYAPKKKIGLGDTGNLDAAWDDCSHPTVKDVVCDSEKMGDAATPGGTLDDAPFANKFWSQGARQAAQSHFGPCLRRQNIDFAWNNFNSEKPEVPEVQYFIAASGWSIDQYKESLKGSGPGNAYPVPNQAIKATAKKSHYPPGGDYVGKANTIRDLLHCKMMDAFNYCDEKDVRTGKPLGCRHKHPNGKGLDNYEAIDPVFPCPGLAKVLVIDDCPFTMAAYRVHLSFMLPEMKTLFVAPHWSIFNDDDVLNFLAGVPSDGAAASVYWNTNVPRPGGAPYKQYSKEKPAMGSELSPELMPDIRTGDHPGIVNPAVGQAVYIVNARAGTALQRAAVNSARFEGNL